MVNVWSRRRNLGLRVFYPFRQTLFPGLCLNERQRTQSPAIWFLVAPGEQFLIKSLTGIYLMSESMPAPVLLFDRHRYGSYSRYFEWDMARNQLLLSFWENSSYLMIYDINSGATLAAPFSSINCSAVWIGASGLRSSWPSIARNSSLARLAWRASS